jgi:hypothetical protein
MPRSVLRCALAGLLLSTACAEPMRSAPGGEYVAHVESPYAVEGAAVIELTSRELVAASASYRVVVGRTLSDSSVALLVINPPADRQGLPLALAVRMAPGAVPPRARVVAVASPADLVRDFPAAYRVRFTRPAAVPAEHRGAVAMIAASDAPIPFARIAEALLGGEALTAAEVARVDATGNRNGRLDPGDLRAYLRVYPAETPTAAGWVR